MPEVIEQPPVSESRPLTATPGDKYREAFEKLSKAEPPKAQESKTEDPPTEIVKEEPKPEAKPEAKPEEKTEVKPEEKAKAESPLDLVTEDKKEESKEPEVPEELKDIPKEFDAKSQKQGEDWRRLRKAADALGERVGQLKTEIAELKKAPKSDPEEIARLTKEREELKASLAEREDLIKSVDIRLSDDYRKIATKRDNELGKIASRARSYGVDADSLVSALLLPDSKFKTDQIKAIMAEVEPDDKARINVLMEKVEGFNEELYDLEKNAPQKFEEIQAKREAQFKEQQEATIKTVQTEFVKLAEALPKDIVTLREVPEDVPGGTEWNQAIKTAKETALRVLTPGGADLTETSAIAYKGAHYDSLMNRYLALHTEAKDMRKRLAEFDSGGPDFKGTTKPTTEAKLTPGEKYQKALAARQAAMDT